MNNSKSKLQLEGPIWALNSESAVIDTILESRPEIHELIKEGKMQGMS